MRKRAIYGLAIQMCAMKQRILKDVYFLTKKGATTRARELNRIGEFRGRAVHTVKIGTWIPPMAGFIADDYAYSHLDDERSSI